MKIWLVLFFITLEMFVNNFYWLLVLKEKICLISHLKFLFLSPKKILVWLCVQITWHLLLIDNTCWTIIIQWFINLLSKFSFIILQVSLKLLYASNMLPRDVIFYIFNQILFSSRVTGTLKLSRAATSSIKAYDSGFCLIS